VSRHPVTLHISLTPRDLAYARAILPHQLRRVGSAVEEVVLTIDTLGRAPAEAGAEFAELDRLARGCAAVAPQFVVQVADYSPERRLELSRRLFAQGLIPRLAYRGAFHAYFDGWLAGSQPFLFHLDSDLLIGGEPAAWIPEAMTLLRSDKTIFTCTPLAGPPRADLSIGQPSRPERARRGAHAFDGFSTRIFFIERERLAAPQPPLRLQRAAWRTQVRGWIEGTSPYALPEDILSAHMRRAGLRRVDFLGEDPGCWSLHPPYRNPAFFHQLDEIVRRVERNDFPDAQRGDYDLNDSVVDWSDARAAVARNRWWRRYGKKSHG
jgi:hypothetical protein